LTLIVVPVLFFLSMKLKMWLRVKFKDDPILETIEESI